MQLIEPALLAVEGVESSESTSSEGRATIRMEFEPGWDMARAADDVQLAVDSVSNLPEEAEEPNVRRGIWRDRVTDVVISGPVGVDQLARFADEFGVRLFAEGVTRVTIRGVAAPQTIVEVPSVNLIRNDISMSQIASAIAQEAVADPAGDVAGANARVRTGIAKQRADQIADIVLRSNADGSKLRVSDVASIRVEGIDRDRSYFVGENQAISVRVDRSGPWDRSDRGDAIKIQAAVQKVADEMQLGLPQGVKIELIRTRAEAITGRLNILLENGTYGLALVVALLFLFLNARTAFWVAAGIPVAMLTALAFMYAAGLTINMISLFALIITLGIVVDDAIVVGEHADFRARRLGEDPVTAAENAAKRMAAPVFAATLTTVIAFFGLVAIGGRFGDLILAIPLTVIAVLLASLLECFLILPRHMTHALTHTAKEHWYDWPSRVVNRGFRWFRDVIFRRFMGLVVWARYPVFALAVVALATQAAVFMRGDVQWRFFSSPERGSISGNFAMLEGATREDTAEMMRAMQKAVEDLGKEYERRHGTNPVTFAMAEIGGNTGRGLSGVENKDRDLLGSIAIELIDRDLRDYSSFVFVADLQDAVPRHPLVETVSFRGWRGGPGGDSLSVEFFGAEATTLKAASEALKTAVGAYPEVSAVEDNLSYDKEELVLDLTPQGQALGFTIDGLGTVLRHRLGGIEAATFPDGTRSASIRVELPPGELTADFLDSTLIRSQTGDWMPLADLVTVSQKTGFSSVRRENGIRVVQVSGDIDDEDADRAAEIGRLLQDEILPEIAELHGVEFRLAGLSEQENRFLDDARTGFILCLLGIFLVLAWVFSSWTRPMVVMAVIPFGLVGAIYGHNVWDVPLSMFSVVGLIGMTGIIINDSIVLVTTVDQYTDERGLIQAIIDAASDRLRPVFLTTATTVLGLTPLLYEGSAQAEFLKPTVITLVYGLGFGMVLVLLVVPALLAMGLDLSRYFRAARRAMAQNARAVPVTAAVSVAIMGGLILFLLTLAPVLVGRETTALVDALPGFAAMPPRLGAFAAFVVLMFALTVSIYAIAVLLRAAGFLLPRRRRKAGVPEGSS